MRATKKVVNYLKRLRHIRLNKEEFESIPPFGHLVYSTAGTYHTTEKCFDLSTSQLSEKHGRELASEGAELIA